MALAPEEIGRRIEAARKKAGYPSHQDFADAVSERLGHRVNLRTVQRWQKGRDPTTGKSWLPRLGTLMEIADLLGAPRSYFVEDEAPSVIPDSELRALRGEVAEQGVVIRRMADLVEQFVATSPKRRAPRRTPEDHSEEGQAP